LAANGPAIDTDSSFVPQERSRRVINAQISRYFGDEHRVLETILHGPVGRILMMIAAELRRNLSSKVKFTTKMLLDLMGVLKGHY
jgi:hypothetical protein